MGRFFTFHFLFPFIVAAATIVHLLFLHQTGSNNPLGISRQVDKIPFHPYFSFKDIVGFLVIVASLVILTLLNPYLLGDPDNFIPTKLGGVIALAISVAILFILPFTHKAKFRSLTFYPLNQFMFWTIVVIVILLTWIGARPVEDPYVLTGQILTVLYFSYYILNPLTLLLWDKLLD